MNSMYYTVVEARLKNTLMAQTKLARKDRFKKKRTNNLRTNFFEWRNKFNARRYHDHCGLHSAPLFLIFVIAESKTTRDKTATIFICCCFESHWRLQDSKQKINHQTVLHTITTVYRADKILIWNMELRVGSMFLPVVFATATTASTTEATGLPLTHAVAKRYDPLVLQGRIRSLSTISFRLICCPFFRPSTIWSFGRVLLRKRSESKFFCSCSFSHDNPVSISFKPTNMTSVLSRMSKAFTRTAWKSIAFSRQSRAFQQERQPSPQLSWAVNYKTLLICAMFDSSLVSTTNRVAAVLTLSPLET